MTHTMIDTLALDPTVPSQTVEEGMIILMARMTKAELEVEEEWGLERLAMEEDDSAEGACFPLLAVFLLFYVCWIVPFLVILTSFYSCPSQLPHLHYGDDVDEDVDIVDVVDDDDDDDDDVHVDTVDDAVVDEDDDGNDDNDDVEDDVDVHNDDDDDDDVDVDNDDNENDDDSDDRNDDDNDNNTIDLAVPDTMLPRCPRKKPRRAAQSTDVENWTPSLEELFEAPLLRRSPRLASKPRVDYRGTCR